MLRDQHRVMADREVCRATAGVRTVRRAMAAEVVMGVRPAEVDTLAAVAVVVDTPRAVAIPAVAVTNRRYKQRVYGQVAVNEVRQRRGGRANWHALSVSGKTFRTRLLPGVVTPDNHGRSYAGLSGAGRS